MTRDKTILLVVLFLLLNLITIAWSLPTFQTSKSKRPTPMFKYKTGGLLLPDNATVIRENIVDTFSCQDRIYGYYADIENECQVFHVCLPQTRGSIRWSFICPGETIFNQATFVCTRTESSIPCQDSERYYILNAEIGKEVEEEEEADQDRGKPRPVTRASTYELVDLVTRRSSTRDSIISDREKLFRRY